MDIQGVLIATVTPFTADGAIDFAYVRKHLRFLEENGVHGVVPCGTNGEGLSLSLDERKRMIEEVIANKGNLLVVPSTGCANLPETAELSLFAESLGADAVLVVPPFFYRGAPREGFLDYYRRLLDGLTVGVLLYNIPMFSCVEITHELLRGLADYPQLAGVKDSSGDAEATKRFISAFPRLKIFNGFDTKIEITTKAGAAGSISGIGNVFPSLVVQAYRESKNSTDGSPTQERINRLCDIYARYPLFSINKSALVYQGFPKTFVRPPLVDLTSEQEDALHRDLRAGGFLPPA